MKHFNLKLVNAITFSLLSFSTFAQNDWHQGGNGLFPPPASVAIPANQLLGTTVNFPLNFIANNTQRMTIQPNGNIGIGTNFTTPQSLLHLNSINNNIGDLFRSDGPGGLLNQWQAFTGSTEKFKLFIEKSSSHVGQQSTQGEMFFRTATTNPAAPLSPGSSGNYRVAERMRLSYGTGGNLSGGFNTPGVTKVLISHDGFGSGYLPPAVAMLNLGSSTPNPSAGNRPWMDIGTYYSMHTDNIYVGLKDEGGPNQISSVINWGNDPAGKNSNRLL
jgi:hypothetical protein